MHDIRASRRSRAGRQLGAAVGIVLAAAACGRDEPSEPPLEPPAANRAPVPKAGAELPDLPPPGATLVQRTGMGYTTLANGASREEVLRQLERLAGFELELAEAVDRDAPITLRDVDLPLEQALAASLRGVEYALHYGVDPGDGSPVLQRVLVGPVALDTRAPAGRNGSPGPHRDDERDPERRALLDALRAQREEFDRKLEELERQREQALLQLEDADPEVRAEAARWIDTDNVDALEALQEVLVSEPDPTVRMAAAESLGEADDEITALGLLLQALEDPNPEVVITALDSIEFVGDETTIPALQPLLRHRDARVRERTLEAIEFLE